MFTFSKIKKKSFCTKIEEKRDGEIFSKKRNDHHHYYQNKENIVDSVFS
jgi:hypothetical protein